MSPQRKSPAGRPGRDSLGAESEANSRFSLAERKATFVEAMYRYVPDDLRILKMQFRGDPNSDISGNWWARPILPDAPIIDDHANVYFTVAAFRKDVSYRRRKGQFGGGVLLMIDDLGPGLGSKFPLSNIDELPPTALIETSPENFQTIYMFDRLVTDQAEFNALINAFVREKLLAQDPGMKGVNRVFRPPFGINGKEKYKRDGKPWKVKLAVWEPERRYSIAEIAEAFGLDLRPKQEGCLGYVPTDAADTRISYFNLVARELQRLGMVHATTPNDDWLDIRCPWVDEHTGGVDNGAAIARPGQANDWHGGFRCHHGHCEERGWRDLTDWLAGESAEALEETNRAAGKEWIQK